MLNSRIVMPVTAKDIASELDLSQPTVSRILNGDKGHRAAEATRKRVWETAKRLGYQPNAIARSLRHGRTDIIGVHTSHNYDVRNDFLGTVVGALQRACSDYQLDLMLHSARNGTPAAEMFGKLRDGRVDGLILHADTHDPLVEMLGESALPVVAIADALPGLDAVTCDDGEGMTQMIELLWARGHRNFAFLLPTIELASVQRRRATFSAELERRGVAATERRIIEIKYEDVEPALYEIQAQGRVAVCCWNDRTAYNLLKVCAARGIAVPEQIAVTGFDGFLDDQLPARRLVTVKCPWENAAEAALKRLVHLIETRQKKQAAPRPQEICLPVTLSQGDTI